MQEEATERAFQLINGYRATQLVRAACDLRIPDQVSEAPKTAGELADPAGIPEAPLRRMLRGLVALGVFVEHEGGRFGATEVSETLTDRPGTMRAWAVMLPGESYTAFGELMYTLETGKPAYDHVFGESRWESLSKDPDASARFNMAMQRWTEQIAQDVVRTYDFTPLASVIDVGGGTGALLATIMRANSHLRGAVLDVAAGLESTDAYLQEQGVRDRSEIVIGDFFGSIPGGYDGYVMKSIVHDWSDDRAEAILRACRSAMDDDARLLLVERIAPTRAVDDSLSRRILMSDMQMMVILGGVERTVEEFTSLLVSAGLELARVMPTGGEMHVIEAVPAS